MFMKEFQTELNTETCSIDENFITFFHSFVIANLDKLSLLRTKKLNEFDSNEIIDYKANLMVTLSHQNISYLDNDVKVLLQVIKNKNNTDNIFEIDEKNLDDLVVKLKEVYNKIKI
jgi:hypothetical protein